MGYNFRLSVPQFDALDILRENDELYCMNEYDIRIKNETYASGCGLGWPYELPEVTDYLRVSLLVIMCLRVPLPNF